MDEAEDFDDSRKRKKRDKHKEKKGKGRKQRRISKNVPEPEDEVATVVSTSYQPSKPLSLKIKLGQGLLTRKKSIREEGPEFGSLDDLEDEEPLVIDQEQWQGESEEETTLVIDEEMEVSQPNQLSDESDEGEWLKALEDGEVDERGYLPKRKGQGNLTARQKAMQGDNGDMAGELLELPVARKSKEITEEMLLKRSERNKRRKLLADKRKEKTKVETVQRLLQKQSVKKKDKKLNMDTDNSAPVITYKNNPEMISLSLPIGMEFPLEKQQIMPPTPVSLCSVKGCNNPKKYSDSITQRPLCSLECYKKLRNCLSQ